jgi:proteasome lid subunit RPN8/RPN11
VPRGLCEAMREQARRELPNECCGVLAGRVEGGVGLVARRYPLVNEAASPTEYQSEPRGLLAAYRDMRPSGLQILAVYHSHPSSPPVPSRTDLERNWYDDAVHLIISLQTPDCPIRAWWLSRHEFREAEWEAAEDDAAT